MEAVGTGNVTQILTRARNCSGVGGSRKPIEHFYPGCGNLHIAIELYTLRLSRPKNHLLLEKWNQAIAQQPRQNSQQTMLERSRNVKF